MSFNLIKWESELNEIGESFGFLHDPLTQTDFLKKHYENSFFVKDLSIGAAQRICKAKGEEVTEDVVESLRAEYSEEFRLSALKGLESYRRQMVVITSTVCETMLGDFMLCYFTSNPAHMYKYVGEKGQVSIKDVLRHDDYVHVIHHFASTASKAFIGKPWESVLNNIEKLLKVVLPYKNDLLSMFRLRNEIVHEAAKPEVTYDDVYDYIECVKGLAEALNNEHNKKFKSDSQRLAL
ncbi:HEPN domain-containing protein [Vibrio atypicus]|uniref:HEPN domain-containing protein n=1 Tax=Vibrio atypicus TaxID=558271 RepID=UPI00135C5101|nr:HEPN domain-containing protein [Vibrio atypicus]